MTNRVNLCTNPSFEVSVANWTAFGPSVSAVQSTGFAVSGTHSILITGAAQPATGYSPYGMSQSFTTVIGTVYTISCTIKNTGGNKNFTPFCIVVNGNSSAPTYGDASTGNRISLTFTATGTATSVAIQSVYSSHFVGGGFTTPSATSSYIDAVLFEASPGPGSYFDGSTASCSWNGTTGLSASTFTSPPGTLTATPDPTNSPPRVLLFANGVTGSTIQVYRLDPDGVSRPVRGGDPGTLTSGQWVGYDYEMPYGQDVTYTEVPDDASTPGSAAAPGMDITQSWLVHPGVPNLSQPINRVMLGDDEGDSGATLHEPLGREFPIQITDGTRKAESSTLSFRTETTTDAANIKALIKDTTPLLLQMVYDFTDESLYKYISLGKLTRNRISSQFGDPRRVWTIGTTDVDRPAGGIAAERTWGDVVTDDVTWQDLLNDFATWTGVVTGILGT